MPSRFKTYLVCRASVQAEVVTADHRILKISDHENADLFWALCGGNHADFYITTQLTMRAPRIPYLDPHTGAGALTVVTILWAGDQFEAAYELWQK